MIQITKITPQGFCKGVHYSIHLVKKAIEDQTTPRPIHILGDLVHNKYISKALEHHGVITLRGENRLKMLESIHTGTVVITAHGTSSNLRNIAENKGLHVIDATCKDVQKTHQIIQEKLNDNFTVFFYGKSGHPETEGVLSIGPNIVLLEDKINFEILPKTKGKIALATQTTMSFLEVYRLHQMLLSTYPSIKLIDEVCNATRLRQEAILLQSKEFDLFLVVGDSLSNNTEMLIKIASSFYKNTKKIQSVDDLNSIDFSKITTIGITSGASTPTKIVDEIINQIKQHSENKNHHYKSILSSDDFLS